MFGAFPKWNFWNVYSARYFLAFLGSIGMAIVYGLKVNLSIAIVSMVNHTALNVQKQAIEALTLEPDNGKCPELKTNGTDSIEDGPFTWPGTMQGTMLSSYFWGYIIAQIPGGRIAELYSAKWVMFFAVAINIVCTVLTPVAAKIHYVAMLAMRIGEGIGGGVTFPAMHVLLARWSPPNERSMMASFVYSGTALGTVVSMLAAGIIAGSLGWEAVFYIMGSISTIWLILWVFMIADSPEEQRFITEDEKKLITSSLGSCDNKKMKIPWKRVLKSSPFIAILVAHTCNNWGWYMMLIELPLYMKSVLKLKIKDNAIFMAIPFFFMWVMSIFLSRVIDSARAKKKITTTFARKGATLTASLIPVMCFVLLCYTECLQRMAIILMAIAIIATGGMFCGFLTNHIDIAPNYAGTLMALTNTVATIPGIIVPIFVGKITENDPSIYSWCKIFWTTVVLYVVEIIVYGYYGSGEEQDWNCPVSVTVEEEPLCSSNQEQETGNYDSTKSSKMVE